MVRLSPSIGVESIEVYMVLFDAEVNADHDRYLAFRSPFLDGHADATGKAVDLAVVDLLIDARIAALGRWLDDPTSAPIGIRTSSPEITEGPSGIRVCAQPAGYPRFTLSRADRATSSEHLAERRRAAMGRFGVPELAIPSGGTPTYIWHAQPYILVS